MLDFLLYINVLWDFESELLSLRLGYFITKSEIVKVTRNFIVALTSESCILIFMTRPNLNLNLQVGPFSDTELRFQLYKCPTVIILIQDNFVNMQRDP